MKKRYSDQQIVAAVKAGKAERQLQQLYDQLWPKVRAYVRKNKGDDQEAQDIFQDAVVIFFRQVAEGKFELNKSVEGYIFTVARNAWTNRATKISRQVNGTDQLTHHPNLTDEDHYLHQTAKKEQAQQVQSLLNKIGERCKELVTLKVFYNMPMDEIALKIGLSGANAAKTQHYKCKQKLIKLLKQNKALREELYS